MLKRNTAGLQEHAQQKRESAFERTDQAIQKLLKEKKNINFGSVSEEAGVSRTWLYNQTDIRDKIEELRDNRSSKKSKTNKSVSVNKTVASSFRASELAELEQKTKKLETENLVLRQHLEIVYGMSDTELVRTVEVLQVENAELKRQLQETTANPVLASDSTSHKLQQRINALESEKKKLLLQHQQIAQQFSQLQQERRELENLKTINQRQSEEIKLLQAALLSTSQELKECQERPPQNSKIASLAEKRNQQPAKSEIGEQLKTQLAAVGIKLNSALTKLILASPESQVTNALSVVKEATLAGKVRSVAGLFRRSLEEEWQPNESDVEREANATQSTFREWYDLARNYGIVQRFQEEGGVMMVQENSGQWLKFEEFSAKWTLQYLRQWHSRNK